MSEKQSSPDLWIKVASTIVVFVVTGLGAIVLERLGSISHDLGSLQVQITDVEQIGTIKERITRIEELTKRMDLQSTQAAFAQLSSAKTQRPLNGERTIIEMELRDAISNIKFDPKRSVTDITIKESGAYFIIAAPQTNLLEASNAGEKNGCFSMWISVNGNDVANSNVRHCFPENDNTSTDVIVSQGVGCFDEEDVINLIMSAKSETNNVGIVAITPKNEPLIPSIIFSIFRVGSC